MAEIIREFIKTFRHELAQKDTKHSVFHGSWDWHSAAHSHWALLESAHLMDDEESLEWVLQRLHGKGMKEEFQYLQQNPDFEMPYGRAWLLRLILRLEELTGNTDHRDATQEVALGLREWLSSSEMKPSIPEYKNPSWALLQLHAWATHSGDQGTIDWIGEVTEKYFTGNDLGLELDTKKGEFFSLWSLQALLIFSVLGPERLKNWLDSQKIDDVQVVKELLSDHHLSINASRAWGFHALYSATGDEKWQSAYVEHVRAAIGLHSEWKDNRSAYSHWVPQFTLYAILIAY